MNFIVLQENLNKGLNFINRFSAVRPQIPVLSNILFKTDEGRIKLSATNLEMGAHIWIGAKVEKEGETTLPAKTITDFIGSLSSGKINFLVNEEGAKIFNEEATAVFNTLPSGDFPAMATPEKEPFAVIDGGDFKEAVKKLIYATATDLSRPILTGVLIETSAKETRMVATDGFRLSFVSGLKLKKSPEKEKKLIVPGRALLEALKITEEQSGEKTISLFFGKEENQIIIASGDCQIATQLIGGEYPSYQKIIPQKEGERIKIDRQLFLKAIKTASVFARESANIIKLKTKPGQMQVLANAPQYGNNVFTFSCEGEKVGEIAFNTKYLLDFLTATEEEEITLDYEGALSPGIFKIPKVPNFLQVIMPVRVQE